jgi:nitrogen fixation/metabolism regulation signal transduction histidine kinase
MIYLLSETSLYATTVIVGVTFLLQVVSLIHYVERTNRDLTRFLASIQYSDFSQSFASGLKGKSFEELNETFSSVISEFQKARSEKEEQYRYLQTVVQHIGLGIMSYDRQGNVDLINNAAKRLLEVPGLKNIGSLKSLSEPLVDTLMNLRPGDKSLVKIEHFGQTLQLIIFATEFRLRDRSLMLVSMQNIESELAEQEMEAWQKLIRVLTHEIMNSVTPIASLASTVNELLEQSPESAGGAAGLTEERIEDISAAATTIERRSKGLLNFVDAYRKLTRIPNPSFQIFPIADLLSRVAQLMSDQIKKEKIDLTVAVNPESLELTADAELVEQVIINLILNSIQALRDTPDRKISLNSRLDERGRIAVSVTDNGPGISDEVKEKIFTPFFTTKKYGSGIGLSLSRQIMRLHRGNIAVQSTPDKETVVSLRF